MTLVLKRSVVAVELSALCAVFRQAQAANLLATETANPGRAILTRVALMEGYQ
jgi:hypothetical protein